MARPASATTERHVPRPARATNWKPSLFDFVGRMTAVVAILTLPPATARAMLPDGLDLAPKGHMAGDRHPLVLLLGQQTGVRPRLLPFGADYLETIVAVPFVELRAPETAPRGPFCYCPRLLLDRRLPIVAGRLLYGYDKRRAMIRMTADSYRIVDPSLGELLLHADFRAAQAARPPSVSDALPLFDLSVISRTARGWRYSQADFGLDRAILEPLELKLTIYRPFVTGLPVGEFAIPGKGDISRAFRVRTDWRLAGPWARRSPPDAGGGPRSAAWR
jgi:hypothetical protein